MRLKMTWYEKKSEKTRKLWAVTTNTDQPIWRTSAFTKGCRCCGHYFIFDGDFTVFSGKIKPRCWQARALRIALIINLHLLMERSCSVIWHTSSLSPDRYFCHVFRYIHIEVPGRLPQSVLHCPLFLSWLNISQSAILTAGSTHSAGWPDELLLSVSIVTVTGMPSRSSCSGSQTKIRAR
mgnify:CR=1 FL=1